MNRPARQISSTLAEHKGPNPGVLAIVFTVLFNTGLYFVISFSAAKPHFPGPWESAETITAYFQGQPRAVLLCAFLQFGSAVPLGLFTATIVSREPRYADPSQAGIIQTSSAGWTRNKRKAAQLVERSSQIVWRMQS